MKIFSVRSRLALLLALLIMLSTLVACSGSSYPKPEATVTSFFEALNKADLQTAQTYCANSSASEFKFKDTNEEKMAKLMFSKTKCEIVSSPKAEGDSATVKIKITGVDMSKVFEAMMKDMMSKAMDAATNGENMDDKKAEEMMMKLLEESIAKADAPVITKEVDVKLVKDKAKKTWVIQDDDAFAKAISGNLDEAMSGKK